MKKKRVKKNKGLVVIKSLLILGTLSATIFSGYFYITEKGESVISKNVYVENINLSDKKSNEAKELLQEKFGQPIASKKIEIIANNRTYTLDCSRLEAKYNIDEAVKEAINYGKEGNIIDRYKSKLSNERKDIKLDFTYNIKAIDELIEKIDKETAKTPVNAKISINHGDINITPGVDGAKLQKDNLKQAILAEINSRSTVQNSEITAAFKIIKPEITTEKLAAVNTLISSFSTNFSTSIPNRINNIELAAKAINGTLLMPGETFSFNDKVGERTKARGYKEAGVIIGDKIETGLGGGICQVSSTLYNAILTANLKAEERRNHSLPLGYVGKGLDATVDWGNIDFKFKNTLDTPIYIEGYTKDKNLYFQIYSNKDLTNRTYKMVSDVYATVQPNNKYINDPSLTEGKTQVIKNGSAGYRVKAYRQTFEDGKLINTELISNDYYMPVDTEIAKGTKK